MSFLVKCKVSKEVFKNGDFRIFGCIPYHPYSEELEINKYGSFSIKGNYPFLIEGREYELEIEELSRDNYGVAYKVISVPSVSLDLDKITYEESFNIMMDVTSSERLANNILTAYPNFIKIILEEGKNGIDLSKIKGVGEAYLNSYERKLNEQYKYLAFVNKYKVFGLDVKECKALFDKFSLEPIIDDNLKNKPYYTLIEVIGRSFEKTDKLLCEIFPNLKVSDQRCEALMMEVLKRNEIDGSSRLNGSTLFRVIRDEYNADELIPLLKDVAQKSDLVYYDEPTKDLSLMSTYMAEKMVSDFVLDKVNNSTHLDIDYSKYTEIRDGILTDEQQNILKHFCDYNITIVDSKGGCVDSETEFFNGKQWKKISEWQPNDKVLQYNEDGTTELVTPLRYTYKTCDKFYHLETKYGLNQTLSDEHRVVYKDTNGELKECTILDIKNLQENTKSGFRGKFITTFNYGGCGIDLTDAEIKIMCAVICDGSFYNKATENQNSYRACRFHIKKDRKKVRLRELFTEANIEWREKESAKEGYTDFYIQAPRREKEFTEYWYNCSNEQLQIICDNIIFWDGSENYTKNNKLRRKFSTTVKTNADFVQFAFSSCGLRASIHTRDRRDRTKVTDGKEYKVKSIEYDVTISDRVLIGLTSQSDNGKTTEITEVTSKDNTKYCFTVPSHLLVLRRNDRIFITGNTGKSASTKALLDMLDDNGMTYTLLAPTGRVAKVLEELTNRRASTIHRAFYANQEEGIWSDVFVLEEGSMVSLELMTMFIKLIANPNARIVINMDLGQIAPIGCGCPMRDIINSGIIPICKLTKVFRYGEGGLYKMATDAYEQKFYLPSGWESQDRISVGTNNDYTFVRYDGTVEQVIEEYRRFIQRKIKPSDISVITPYNVTPLGTININNKIQEIVNEGNNDKVIEKKIRNQNVKFKIGDIILNTKNNYDVMTLDGYNLLKSDDSLANADVETAMCMNGELGLIVDIEEGNIIAKFEDNILVFDKNMQNELLLGYSLTSYKLQGSSVPYVISLITPEFAKTLDKNIIYTDMSRTKKEIVEIIDPNTLSNAILIDSTQERNTWMEELLKSKN